MNPPKECLQKLPLSKDRNPKIRVHENLRRDTQPGWGLSCIFNHINPNPGVRDPRPKPTPQPRCKLDQWGMRGRVGGGGWGVGGGVVGGGGVKKAWLNRQSSCPLYPLRICWGDCSLFPYVLNHTRQLKGLLIILENFNAGWWPFQEQVSSCLMTYLLS